MESALPNLLRSQRQSNRIKSSQQRLILQNNISVQHSIKQGLLGWLRHEKGGFAGTSSQTGWLPCLCVCKLASENPPFSHSITVEGDSEGAHRTSLVFSHALSDMQSRTADNRQWTYAEPAP